MVNFDDDDEGKSVIDASNEEVGTVANVQAGTAYVDPNPDLVEEAAAKLGFSDTGEDTYELDDDAVDSVSDDEVRLNDER
jgi:hypothetical protein